MKSESTRRAWAPLGCVLALLTAACGSGCQVSVAGQTLPSPYYQYDDIQYYAPGPEFKLSEEAAAMRQFRADADLLQGNQP